MTIVTPAGLRLSPLGLLILLMICLSLPGWQSADAAPNSKGTKTAAKKPQKPPIYYPPGSYEDDVLLLMPNKDAEQEEINKAIKEVDGTVIGKLEHRGVTIYKIKTAKGKLAEVEKKLSADENFGHVDRNGIIKPNQSGLSPVSSGTTNLILSHNDPYFPQEWYLNAVRAREACKIIQYNGRSLSNIVIAVIDSGCQASIADLSGGRTYPGVAIPFGGQMTYSFGNITSTYEAPVVGGGQYDISGHGTQIATVAAANPNNGIGTAGVAPNALIYPVRVSDSSSGNTDVFTVMAALDHIIYMMDSKKVPIKIVNISMNTNPSFVSPTPAWVWALHPLFKEIYDKGGIVFNSSGNSGKLDSSPMLPYLCVVSAIDNYKRHPSWSVYGPPIWFTCPGTNIYCSGRTGTVLHGSSTSFASSVCAGVAALIWGANPNWSNTQLLYAMKHTCNHSFFATSGGAAYFGYGLPDCAAALKYLDPGLKD